MISSPTATRPENEVPVITVPNPFIENTRSTARRNGPNSSWKSMAATRSSSRRTISSMPVRLIESTATIGAPSRKLPRKNSPTSSVTISSQSGSTRSRLVSTTRPSRTPSSRQISKCSTVCGMMPSSAAMTKATRSMPAVPATMLRMNFSWPGTSTMPRR